MIEVTGLRRGFGRQAGQGKVIYKPGDNRLGRFPEAGSDDLLAGPKRNFQVFDPLDFRAACPAVASERRGKVTQHPPSPRRLRRGRHSEAGEHLIRYDGFYSNKSRGCDPKDRLRPRHPPHRTRCRLPAPSSPESGGRR